MLVCYQSLQNKNCYWKKKLFFLQNVNVQRCSPPMSVLSGNLNILKTFVLLWWKRQSLTLCPCCLKEKESIYHVISPCSKLFRFHYICTANMQPQGFCPGRLKKGCEQLSLHLNKVWWWFFFSAGLFCLAGFYQMAVWAKAKHRNYLKEFKDYPRSRTAIVPFLL